jgi:hypothetical protein
MLAAGTAACFSPKASPCRVTGTSCPMARLAATWAVELESPPTAVPMVSTDHEPAVPTTSSDSALKAAPVTRPPEPSRWTTSPAGTKVAVDVAKKADTASPSWLSAKSSSPRTLNGETPE